ncbi:hypothetical protein [Streptomyces althioticus]|uniref:hypothetical protein n=2 Tax=Streptomyces althioticus group TaxID=2867194 RepID=UPI0033CE3EF8
MTPRLSRGPVLAEPGGTLPGRAPEPGDLLLAYGVGAGHRTTATSTPAGAAGAPGHEPVLGDPFGAVLRCCWEGGGGRDLAFEVVERDGGFIIVQDADKYCEPQDQWPQTGQWAVGRARGSTRSPRWPLPARCCSATASTSPRRPPGSWRAAGSSTR